MLNNTVEKWKSSMSHITDDDILLIVSKIKNSKALNGGFDALETNIEELKADVKDIKENLYHPDQGLYSRVVKVDQEAKTSTRRWEMASKVIFLILGAIITVSAKFLFE